MHLDFHIQSEVLFGKVHGMTQPESIIDSSANTAQSIPNISLTDSNMTTLSTPLDYNSDTNYQSYQIIESIQNGHEGAQSLGFVSIDTDFKFEVITLTSIIVISVNFCDATCHTIPYTDTTFIV